jgi:predicted PurR-regulated permease PerM
MYKYTLLAITLFFFSISSFSQSGKKFIDTGSVKNQFDYLLNESNNYQDYKVVKQNWLIKLQSNVSDTLTASKKNLLNSYSTISNQLNSIDSLKVVLNKSENTISNLSNEKQSIDFLGVQFNKGMFKTILFSIIGLLTLLLIVFITKFKQSNKITTQAKKDLKVLEEEFEEHRKRALEREQKAMRKLQDELNKNKKE